MHRRGGAAGRRDHVKQARAAGRERDARSLDCIAGHRYRAAGAALHDDQSLRVDRDRAEQRLDPAPQLARGPAGGDDPPGIGDRDRPVGADRLIRDRRSGAAGLSGIAGQLGDPAVARGGAVAGRESGVRTGRSGESRALIDLTRTGRGRDVRAERRDQIGARRLPLRGRWACFEPGGTPPPRREIGERIPEQAVRGRFPDHDRDRIAGGDRQLGGRQMLLEALAERRARSRRQHVDHRLVDLDDVEGDLALPVRLRDDILAQRQIRAAGEPQHQRRRAGNHNGTEHRQATDPQLPLPHPRANRPRVEFPFPRSAASLRATASGRAAA